MSQQEVSNLNRFAQFAHELRRIQNQQEQEFHLAFASRKKKDYAILNALSDKANSSRAILGMFESFFSEEIKNTEVTECVERSIDNDQSISHYHKLNEIENIL